MRASSRRRPGRDGSCSVSAPRRSFSTTRALDGKKTLGPMRDAVKIVRGVLGGEPFVYEGDTWSADVPACRRKRDSPRRSARLRRRNGAEDAGARGRDCRRLPDAVDHDAGLRSLHARERRCRHRHRLHDRRVDPRVRPRRRARRRSRDRRHVPREQGAEHQGRSGHAARSRGPDPGRDPTCRRGDGAGRARSRRRRR